MLLVYAESVNLNELNFLFAIQILNSGFNIYLSAYI